MAFGKFLSANLLVMLILSFALTGVGFVTAQTNDVASKLQEANTAVEQAFNAISAAEKIGANVTKLLNQLNDATNLLAEAQNALRIGDKNTALNNANAVIPIGRQVTTQAQTAIESAAIANQNFFYLTIALATISSFIFVLILFLVWRRFKNRYINNLMKAKPEVNNQ